MACAPAAVKHDDANRGPGGAGNVGSLTNRGRSDVPGGTGTGYGVEMWRYVLLSRRLERQRRVDLRWAGDFQQVGEGRGNLGDALAA
jgi:hypothetical protein